MLPNGSLVWIVTRYEEVRQALSEPKLSKSFKGLNELMARHTKEGMAPKQYDEALVGHMLASDPPDHTRMRRLVNKAFTPRRVEGMRTMLEELTSSLLDEMEKHDEIDLLEALAFPVPMELLCTLLGVPEAERLAFGRYASVVLADLAPEGYEEATTAMREYLVKLIQVKRDNPGDDLLSALIAARDEDDKLSEGELLATIYLMFSMRHRDRRQPDRQRRPGPAHPPRAARRPARGPCAAPAGRRGVPALRRAGQPRHVPVHGRAGDSRRCDHPGRRGGDGVADGREP